MVQNSCVIHHVMLLFMYVHTICDRDFTSDGPSCTEKNGATIGYLTNVFEMLERNATPHLTISL